MKANNQENNEVFKKIFQKKMSELDVILEELFKYQDNISSTYFDSWLKKSNFQEIANEEPGGIYKSTANDIRKNLLELKDKYGSFEQIKEKSIPAIGSILDQFSDKTNKAKKYVKYIKLYLKDREYRFEEIKEETQLHYETSSELTGKVFQAYFLNIKNGITKNAELGRAIFKTTKGLFAEFIFSDNYTETTYYGVYEFLKGSQTIVFDLSTIDDTRHVHLKLRYTSPQDEIMLGLCLIYDQRNISSIRILLKQIKDSEEPEKPALLSYKEKEDQFKNIDSTILAFLSIKKNNFQTIPSDDGRTINSLRILQTHVNKYSPFDNKENSFLDFPKPILFVATPKSSNNEHFKSVTEIITKLKSKYKNHLNIQNREPDKKLPPIDSLKIIRKTRIFVFIFTEKVEKASYSLVQLGWALAHCKQIILIYNRDVISNRFYKIKDSKFVHTHRYENLKSETPSIISVINTIIDSSLEKNINE
jgi:hypothetical protein